MLNIDKAASLFKSIIKRFENCTLGTSKEMRNRRKAVFFCGEGMRACPQIPEEQKKRPDEVRSVSLSFVPQNRRITEARGSAAKVIRSEPF